MRHHQRGHRRRPRPWIRFHFHHGMWCASILPRPSLPLRPLHPTALGVVAVQPSGSQRRRQRSPVRKQTRPARKMYLGAMQHAPPRTHSRCQCRAAVTRIVLQLVVVSALQAPSTVPRFQGRASQGQNRSAQHQLDGTRVAGSSHAGVGAREDPTHAHRQHLWPSIPLVHHAGQTSASCGHAWRRGGSAARRTRLSLRGHFHQGRRLAAAR